MNAIPVIAVFDIGKTNKKLFLFDEQYRIVFEKSARLTETNDEDGFPCENLETLRIFILNFIKEIFNLNEYKVKAINFSTYGASLVYIDKKGNPLTPLYNYLKPYPDALSERFYQENGGREIFSLQTASPVLGSLNAGLQLYQMKKQKPERFKNLMFALHLPQYLSSLITGRYFSDLTSIGCHTGLWDFRQFKYHDWVQKENLNQFLAPIESGEKTFPSILPSMNCEVGIGLHDSSAALIPYLVNVEMPFVLISTGTWSISMNPFNKTALTHEELDNDCLCYLQYKGEPVKASRLHAGLEHEKQTNRIAAFFNQNPMKYGEMVFSPEIIQSLKSHSQTQTQPSDGFIFHKRDLADFKNDEEAYHQLLLDIVGLQVLSTRLVIKGSPVKRIFVDGGFSNNHIFMHLLANAFPELEVFAASIPQATALGAALVIYPAWNSGPIPNGIVGLKYYSPVML